MKTKLFTLLLAVAASIGTMFAWDYERVPIGDLYYNLDATNQTAEVTYKSYTNYIYNESWGITTANIPASVTYSDVAYSVTNIGDRAFYGCSGLTSIEIPNSVTSIGYEAFAGCSGLKSVTIPNSVTSIGDEAFYICSGLTSVTIPNSVTSIGIGAFSGYSGLTSIVVENGNTVYDCRDNCNAIIETATNTLIGGCQNTIIPNSVTSIGKSAFYYCTGLTSVTIPNSVTSIGSNAFHGCSSLTSVTIGNGVSSIGNKAFSGCTGLTSVTIEAETPPTLGIYAFYNTNIPIYVPCGTLDAYKTAWTDYASRISYAPPYKISTQAEYGSVGITSLENYTICDEQPYHYTLTVTANYGYHFTQWSDGNTDNPRTIILASDTSFTAEFAKNTYTISTTSANPEWGTTAGDTAALYLDEVEISAIPNYGYHFAKWSEMNSIPDNSITVADAIKATLELAENTPSSNQYIVVGYIVGKYGSYYNSYYIADTPDGESTFVIYRSDNSASIGEKVMISGYLLNYYGTPEIMQGGKVQPVNHSASTANPYTLTVTEDKTYIANFAKNVYSITANAEHGSISGNSSAEYLDEVTLSVSSDYGYHFAQWSDGNIDNPRSIILASDTTFTAEFAKNTYTISTTSANPEWGTTAGDTAALYLDEIEISAAPNYGYHFVRWNDNNGSNPRTVSVTEDKTYTATFAKNVYSITKNAEHGTISGNSSAEYLDFVTLTVTSDYGYHFTQWSDGLKDNPRIFQITQDTTFTAEFAYDRVGTCGKDLALVWSYDPANKVLTIGNAGSFTENMQFGVEAPGEMEELVIGNSVTAIGANAFAGIETLKKVSIGESVKTIGEQAFYNCVNLETIFNYRPTPTNTYSNAFDGVDKFECTLYVLPSSIDMYKAAAVWRDFYYTYAIGAEEATVTTNDVQVEPQDNAATVTWPTSNNAASYTIQITKDGVVFCTLIFNANGQLTGIAFAPSRDGQAHAPAAVMTANGLQFTVTGLDSNTQYGYSVTAKDANDQTVATYSGEFTTTSEGTATGIDEISSSLQGGERGRLILHNGQIFILRGEKKYTLTGQELK